MTLQQAQQLITKHEHIIGTVYNNEYVAFILIVPKSGNNRALIIDNAIRGFSSQALLNMESEFDVIALFDTSQRVQRWTPLVTLLNHQP